MPARTQSNCFGQNAGYVFSTAGWIVQALAHGFPGRAIGPEEDCAQLGERLICTVGGHGVGETRS
jgi:hypothetical protein